MAWAFRYVGVTLQNTPQQKETERARSLYRRELFRSGESILLLDRNPIWTRLRTHLRTAAVPCIAFPAELLAAAREYWCCNKTDLEAGLKVAEAG